MKHQDEPKNGSTHADLDVICPLSHRVSSGSETCVDPINDSSATTTATRGRVTIGISAITLEKERKRKRKGMSI